MRKLSSYLIPNILIFFIFLILSILMTYPLLFNLKDGLTGSDALYVSWTLAWDAHQILINPTQIFNANIFYPFPNSLAFSEHLIGLAVIAAPLIWLLSEPLLVHNILLLFSFGLSGYAMFLLAEYITKDKWAAFLAGLIFAFFPYRFHHLFHLDLQWGLWMPLILLFLHKYQEKGKNTTLLGLFIVLLWQFLSGWYYSIYFSFVFGIAILWLTFVTKPLHSLKFFSRVVLISLLCGLLIAPLVIPYFKVKKELSAIRPDREVQWQSSDLQSYLAAPKGNFLYGRLPFQAKDNFLFPGLIPVFLAITGIVYLIISFLKSGIKSNSDLKIFLYLIILVICFLLSLGPTLFISTKNTHIELPYRWLMSIFPPFQSMRAPERFAMIVMLALSVLAGFGITKLIEKKSIKTKFIIYLFLFPLILIEYCNIPISLEKFKVNAEAPAVYQWLSEQPEEFAILELPYEYPFRIGGIFLLRRNVVYVYYSTYHWKYLVNGAGAFLPDVYKLLAEEFLKHTFPSEESKIFLKNLTHLDKPLKYVIFHKDLMSSEESQKLEDRFLNNFELEFYKQIGSSTVYRFKNSENQSL